MILDMSAADRERVEPVLRSRVASVQSFINAAVTQRLDIVEPLMTEDVVYHVPGRHALAGTFRGRADVLAHLQRMWDLPEFGFDPLRYEDWLISEDRVLLMLQTHLQVGGRVREGRRYFLCHFVGEAIDEMVQFEGDDQALIDVFVGPQR